MDDESGESIERLESALSDFFRTVAKEGPNVKCDATA